MWIWRNEKKYLHSIKMYFWRGNTWISDTCFFFVFCFLTKIHSKQVKYISCIVKVFIFILNFSADARVKNEIIWRQLVTRRTCQSAASTQMEPLLYSKITKVFSIPLQRRNKDSQSNSKQARRQISSSSIHAFWSMSVYEKTISLNAYPVNIV